jgi:hypothetical protein
MLRFKMPSLNVYGRYEKISDAREAFERFANKQLCICEDSDETFIIIKWRDADYYGYALCASHRIK